MTKLKDYNECGAELERLLLLRTSPIAVKMLEDEADIPEGAFRPKKDHGYHLAQCQAFAMSRRQKETVAMLTEDHWCWAPLMGYGLVEADEDFFSRSNISFPCLERGKYIGMVTAPLKTASFEPDLVLIYSNTAQLRTILMIAKYQEKVPIPSEFDPIDSCVYSVIPVLLNGKYRITIPDPGEYERAMAGEDEIIFSVPIDKLEPLVAGLKQREERNAGYTSFKMEMRPDFPRPAFYKDIFKKLGLDVED